jgi:putative peptidoglycan lipid II flippase
MAWVGVAGLGLSLALFLFAPGLITLTGPGLSDLNHASAIDYLRILAPVAFVTVISLIVWAICQAEGRFSAIAVATVAGPTATFIAMLVLWDSLQLGALAVGSVLGSIVTLAVLVVSAARASAVPIPVLGGDPRLRALFRHAAPLTLSGGILQIRGIADRAIASLFGPGSVSALRYATVLIQPLAQIGPAWASVIYPRLVQSTLGVAGENLAVWADQMLRSVVAIFVPVAALTAAVAPLAVFVAFGRGEFTASDIGLTAGALAAYAPILVTLMALPILTGAHNARRRGRLMLVGGTLNVVLNIVLDITLGYWLGTAGIALASSIAEIVVVVLFIERLGGSVDAFDLRPLARTCVLALVATAPAAVAVAIVTRIGVIPDDTAIAVASLVACGVLGVASYVLLASAMGVETARTLLQFVLDRVARMRGSVRGS